MISACSAGKSSSQSGSNRSSASRASSSVISGAEARAAAPPPIPRNSVRCSTTAFATAANTTTAPVAYVKRRERIEAVCRMQPKSAKACISRASLLNSNWIFTKHPWTCPSGLQHSAGS